MSSFFHSDSVLTTILSLLPVKSLKRFCCVNRSFNSTIQDPEFVDLHFQTSRNLILLFSEGSREIVLASDDLQIEEEIPIPDDEDDDENDYVKFIGSCRGILCFLQYNKLKLWNPSCHKFKIVTADTDLKHDMLVGFSFVELLQQFKILTVKYEYGFSADIDEHGRVRAKRIIKDIIAHVYHKNWRVIECAISCYPLPGTYQVQINAQIHWLAIKCPSSLSGAPDCILTFDANDETFHEIELPLPETIRATYRLVEFEGCLSFIFCLENQRKMWIRRRDFWEEREGFELKIPYNTTCTNMKILNAANENMQFLVEGAYHLATDFTESLYTVESDNFI